MNPFATLGLPARFDVDPEQIEQRYRDLQRALHPDKFAQASAAERRMSLSKAVEVNEAYRAMRDDLERAKALLAVFGVDSRDERAGAADPEFLMEVMELREALGEARARKDLAKVGVLAERVRKMQRATLDDMTVRFGTLPDRDAPGPELAKLTALLAQLRYFRRFLDEVAVIEEEALS